MSSFDISEHMHQNHHRQAAGWLEIRDESVDKDFRRKLGILPLAKKNENEMLIRLNAVPFTSV